MIIQNLLISSIAYFGNILRSGKMRTATGWLACWAITSALMGLAMSLNPEVWAAPLGLRRSLAPVLVAGNYCLCAGVTIAIVNHSVRRHARIAWLCVAYGTSIALSRILISFVGLHQSLAQDALNFATIMVLAVVLRAAIWGRRASARLKEAEELREAAEQRALATQLSPHTLFNIINTIYSVSLTSPEKVSGLLLSFAEIFRHVAKAGQSDFVSIADEISFMNACKSFALARAAPGSHVELIVDGDADERVPPILMGSLFENALKNGFKEDGRLMVRAELRVAEERISFRVENPVCTSRAPAFGLGFGNELTRRRLELHFPSRHNFNQRTVDGIYVAELEMW